MKRLLTAAAGAALMLAAAPATAQVTNGGFEDPGATGGTIAGIGAFTTVAPFWNIYNNANATTTATLVASTAPGGGANMFHIVTNGGADGLYQFPAGLYGFLQADFYVLSGVAQLISAYNGATVDGGAAFVTTTALGRWQRLTVNYAGGANEPVLYSFAAGADFYVDNVVTGAYRQGEAETSLTNLSGTPEPGAWALMILGFGGVGAVLRRQRTAAVAA